VSGMFQIILPAAILISGAFIIYLLTRLLRLSNKAEAILTLVVLSITLSLLIYGYINIPNLIDRPDGVFGTSEPGGIIYSPNAIGVFILIVAVVIGIMVTLYSGEYLSRDPRYLLYYPLILLLIAGLMGMFISKNLFNLFLLTEFVTVTASALIAFRFYQEIAIKAGFKYLIMSSLGTMMMLLGIYFVFRSTGEMHLDKVLASPDNFTRIGAASFLLGFSLKAGVVPLHTWVPDVYGHAPSAISGLLAGVISKSMLFIMPPICLRLGMSRMELGGYLMIFACFNMLIGSTRMLKQPLLRRFLSFSSISQTGYLMFALGIGFYYDLEQAFSAALFLFLIIAVMKSLAFLSAGIYEYYSGSQNIDQLSGIGTFIPLPALFFGISLAGLAGIPLLAGFIGKWLVFSAAFASGDLFAIICLIVFLISSVISLGGYLPVLVKQYQPSSTSQFSRHQSVKEMIISKWMLVPVGVLTLLVVIMGLYPSPMINVVNFIVRWMMI